MNFENREEMMLMTKIGDNIEIMPEIESDSVDLVITSPPYDDMRDYHGYKLNVPEIANQILRILKPGGVCVWVVGDRTKNGSETGTSFRHVETFMQLGFRLHDTMIYTKTGFSTPSNNRYHQKFEYMFVFSNGAPKTFNPIKDKINVSWLKGWTSGKTTRQVNGKMTDTIERVRVSKYGMRGNVWKYKTGKGLSSEDAIAFEHPAIFPEELARDHIYTWTNAGDVVLDPMFGSGTTLKMAYLMKRHSVGIECSEEYYKIFEDRMKPYIGADIELEYWDNILCPDNEEKIEVINANEW